MAQSRAQKTAGSKAQDKAGKRSLVSRAGAAARKAVGRGTSKNAAPTKDTAKKATATKTAAKKSSAKKAPAKKAPAKKNAAKKNAAKKSPAKKAPAKKGTAKKAPAKKSTATKQTAKKAPAARKTAAKKAPASKAAANKAPARKSTAKKAPAKQTTTKKTVSKKTAATKAPAKKTSGKGRSTPDKLVVLEAEDPWSKDELAEVRGQLRDDVKRLTAELEEAEDDLSVWMRDAGEDAGSDQADIGSATFERDQEMTIVNNARDMLLQSERALERISAGTYGVCESCGNPIGKNRLMAFPRATLCMTCKQREERR